MNKRKVKKQRIIYLVTAILLLLFLGLSYGWSVFRGPLEDDFGWSRQQTAFAFTLSFVFFCLGGITSGKITKIKGNRPVMLASTLFICGGFLMASGIRSLAGIYIAYGVLFGYGCGMCYNAILSTIVKWFPDKQGFISGTVLMGYGLGALVFGTFAGKLITDLGWRMTFVIYACCFFVIIPAGAVILKAAPHDIADIICKNQNEMTDSFSEVTPREMIRKKNFILFFLWETALASAGFAVINEAAPFAVSIMNSRLTTAAAAAGIVSLCNGIARGLSGLAFDKTGYKVTMIGVCFINIAAGISLIATMKSGSMTLLILSFVLAGIGYGGAVPLNSAFAIKFFGRNNYGLNYSIVNLNPMIAAVIGPSMGAGDYMQTFVLILALSILAMVLTLFIGNKNDRNN